MKLTVVTHTNVRYARDISRCVASVKAALTPECSHVVIELDVDYDGFVEARYKALKLGEAIAFVDDDDYITPDALRLCLQALNQGDPGLVFTKELSHFPDKSTSLGLQCPDYRTISSSPSAIHHLAAIRTEAVTDRSLDLAKKHGCGIEWVMKAEAAIFHGAVHIPKIGYHYVRHPGQTTCQVVDLHRKGIKPIAEELRAWRGHTGLIPILDTLDT